MTFVPPRDFSSYSRYRCFSILRSAHDVALRTHATRSVLPCSARIQAAARSVPGGVRVFNTIDEWHSFRRAGGVAVPLEEPNNAFNNRVSRKSPRMSYQPRHPDVRHAWTCIASAHAYGLSGAHRGRNSYGSAFHGHVVAKGLDSRFANELG